MKKKVFFVDFEFALSKNKISCENENLLDFGGWMNGQFECGHRFWRDTNGLDWNIHMENAFISLKDLEFYFLNENLNNYSVLWDSFANRPFPFLDKMNFTVVKVEI